MQEQLTGTDMTGMVGLEDQLAAALDRAANEMARLEYIDDEQRSEIYTILQAMQSDTQIHRNLVGRWVSDREQGRGDA